LVSIYLIKDWKKVPWLHETPPHHLLYLLKYNCSGWGICTLPLFSSLASLHTKVKPRWDGAADMRTRYLAETWDRILYLGCVYS